MKTNSADIGAAETLGYSEAKQQFETQGCFSSGTTWDNAPELNEAYDRGVNRAEAEHTKQRLGHIRGELRAERISYGELAELQSLARHIEPGDVELLEAAGMPEVDSDSYDTEAIAIDLENGNFDAERVEDYRHENIVRASLINGQFTQAREQCASYGLNYELEKYKFDKGDEA